MIPMLFGISVLMFIIMHMAPGDPASLRYGLNPDISAEARENFSRMYGLDRPVAEQYVMWVRKMIRLDFGRSLVDDRPVIDKIWDRLPATLLLQVTSLLCIFLVSLPLGIYSAVRKGSRFDTVSGIIVLLGYATPTFWLALILIYVFGFKIQLLPISGMSPWYTAYYGAGRHALEILWHLVLPVICTAIGSMAV